ncbi:MAG: hypothetical protein DWQ01_14005 [Planctomycetota bacterium]|nr:MAG: hypothetical protein DWQ01_14005 [Planctomycetota bacterium]
MRISFPLLSVAALSLLSPSPRGAAGVAFPSTVPIGASIALIETLPGREEPAEELFVHARTLAERVRTGTLPGQEIALRRRLELAVRSLASLPNAAELPWEAWMEAHRTTLPELTEELFLAARQAMGSQIVPLAMSLDRWDSPRRMRVDMHQTLWAYDPIEGRNASRRVLIKEKSRSNSPLKAELIREVIAHQPGMEAEALLLEVAQSSHLPEEWARREAIRALRERNNRQSAQKVATEMLAQFLANPNNLGIRMEAFQACMSLYPALGMPFLTGEQAVPASQPQLEEFMEAMRRRYGLVSDDS